MSTQTLIPADVMSRMQQAAAKAAKGIRSPVEMRLARQELNRLREELRQEIGTVELSVDLIRDARKS